MKDKIFSVLQRVGRSFMLPIAILPVAGLLLGLGQSLTNADFLKTYGLNGVMGEGTVPYAIFTVMGDAGNIIFGNLPLIFAIGVAIGMAKKEKHVAALSSVIAFLIMHAAIGSLITINGGAEAMLANSTTSVLGITSLQLGVFGGIIVGLGVAALHNKFYKIELPQVISFFGGERFVPIISGVVYLLVGMLLFFIWPPVQNVIYKAGELIMQSGYAGTWLYGFIERLLIPFGLHHVFYLPIWQTALGGTAVIGGQVIEGAQNIFFAELAQGGSAHFSVAATRFMSGKFPLMIFGLPGAALAMYKCAKSSKKKVVGGLLLSAALTSMVTGITEPIEFTFLFVAPVLYGIHCVFAGLAYMLMHILNVGVGMTFSGGLIDLTLFGILQGNAKTSWVNIIFVGIIYFVVYYFLFTFLIKKLNLKTPGREEDDEETKLYTRADVNAKNASHEGGASSHDELSAMITKGLGGKANISDVDCCATRLRVTVYDSTKVDKGILQASGASGVIVKGEGVQVIYGPKVTVIKANLEEYLASEASNHVEEVVVEAKQEVKEEVKSTKEASIIASPMDGEVVALSEVGDGVFSEEMCGKGFAIKPANGKVVSPVDGTVTLVFDTKHAIGFTTEDGLELLLHMGIDTVKLDGKCFDVHVKQGDTVKKGDLLADVDFDGIIEAGYKSITPVVVTNTDDYSEFNNLKQGEVKQGDNVLEVR